MKVSSLSIIIPTKGRGTLFLNTLRSIANQPVVVNEVIIVDQSKNPIAKVTLEGIFKRSDIAPKLIYCHAPWLLGASAARNYGIKHASGKIIQFLDDDVVLEKDYFLKFLQAFNNADVGGVAGLVIEPNTKTSFLKKVFFGMFYIGPFRQIREEAYLNPPRAQIETNTLPGVSAYRREVFEEFSFDEGLVGPSTGEDVDFSYRVGKSWKLVIHPDARICHYPSTMGRGGKRQSFEDKICFYHYHFNKNLQKTPFAWFVFIWLNIGFAIHALSFCQSSAILGAYTGWRKILQKQVGAGR
jgi:glycosyltransferase involved in cell wall biosynthesis